MTDHHLQDFENPHGRRRRRLHFRYHRFTGFNDLFFTAVPMAAH